LWIGVNQDGNSNPAATCTLSLIHLSRTIPTATEIRQMYDAEKGMFVASAECLLQSGSTDAVLDVNVDPLTNKVLVTQTDAITIFDGLVVDSKPTVNSGNSEKGKLWGDLRAEQNSANAYVTAPAVDQRQVNEMVRGLASDLPKGVDLSKAKAWCVTNADSTIRDSYNVKSITDNSAGAYDVNWGIPFKTNSYCVVATSGNAANGGSHNVINNAGSATEIKLYCTNFAGNPADTPVCVVAFGELENE